MICSEHSLKKLNTFGLDIAAREIVYATHAKDILDVWQQNQRNKQPTLLIGGGSNLLFLDNFAGTVVVNQLKGIKIQQTENEWLLHVAAGENWHSFVEYTIEQGISGLENLALIPGTVGSAPIQNIGAYGVELQDVCHYVDLLSLDTQQTTRLSQQECQFGYRESVFKHNYRQDYVITTVGFRLKKNWVPILNYGLLSTLDRQQVCPRQIFDMVCEIRRSKLPDPMVVGNAGSFFKNPVVTSQQADKLLSLHPTAPTYPQVDGSVKIAAGWLIEQVDMKGVTVGGAAVHKQQALVLLNMGHAQPTDIVNLAKQVRDKVGATFDIWLEPEVRFIGPQGEVDAAETLK